MRKNSRQDINCKLKNEKCKSLFRDEFVPIKECYGVLMGCDKNINSKNPKHPNTHRTSNIFRVCTKLPA
jgi:hypothetical protein